MKSSDRPIREVFRFFWSKHSRAILTGLVTIILIDVTELIMPLVLRDLVDSVSVVHRSHLLHRSVWFVLLMVLIQAIGRYVWRVSLARGAMQAGAEFRKIFSTRIFEISFPSFEKRKVGELMTLATSDIENIRIALGPGLIAAIDAFFYCITIPFAMLLISPFMTGKVILPLLAIPVVVVVLQGLISSRSAEVQTKTGELGSMTQEAVAGVRLAKIYGAQERIADRILIQSHDLNQSQIGLARVQAILVPSMDFLLSCGLVLLFGFSSGLSVGTLVALQRYVQKLIWPLMALGMSVVYFQKARASGRSFYQFLEEPRTETLEKGEQIKGFFLCHDPLIEARNLSYGPIQNLSFKVAAGEWLGIQGPVASGKSTLFSLLLRFYDPPRGTLFVNGRDILDWDTKAIRDQFSSVLQEPYLFQGSIRTNLEVGEEFAIEEALATAQVQKDLSVGRLDEDLGEKGASLSGGQKQRVAIARALRRQSRILLLDDPVSSVDLETASKVLSGMFSALQSRGKTVIFISHRAEHLSYCKLIIHLTGAPKT